MRAFILSLLVAFSGVSAHAGEAHEFAVIDTCYHWLTKPNLDAKISHARENNGAFYFYGTGPAYCWRSPIGAYSSWETHGDYLIRVKFKPGTQITHRPRESYNRSAMVTPVYYSNDNGWHEYTMTPEAVESWSVFRPETSIEMAAELKYYEAGLVTANDVFYPFQYFDLDYVKSVITNAIDLNNQGLRAGASQIYGANPQRHFATSFPQPWTKFLVRGANMRVIELPKIKVIQASFGLNLGAAQKGNVTTKVATFCDGKVSCTYAIAVRFLGVNPQPEKEKSFDVSWTCGKAPKVYTGHVDAPTRGKSLDIACPF